MTTFNPPIIETLEDILPHIEGDNSFGVMDRGPFIVVNYHHQESDTFAGPSVDYRRECRGLLFDINTHKLVSRRFHKFFNVGEKVEYHADSLPWPHGYRIDDKIDGSMVSFAPVAHDITRGRWTTKMGITETAQRAEAWAVRNLNYVMASTEAFDNGATAIFEWLSPEDRIVIDYGRPRMVLTAVRDIKTGLYWSRARLLDFANSFLIDLVPSYTMSDKDHDKIIKQMKGEREVEGYVVTFTTGEKVKVKNDWYVTIHRCKDKLGSPRHVVAACLADTLDDEITVLPEGDRARVAAIRDKFWYFYKLSLNTLETIIAEVKASGISRKDFALNIAPKMLPHQRAAVFATWDGKMTAEESYRSAVERTLRTETSFREEFENVVGPVE